MTIHNFDEFPFKTSQHLQHKTKDIVRIEYTPTLDIIDTALSAWKPELRNCFMEREKQLKYFKIYTKTNCEHECLGETILHSCGCVPFFIISA